MEKDQNKNEKKARTNEEKKANRRGKKFKQIDQKKYCV